MWRSRRTLSTESIINSSTNVEAVVIGYHSFCSILTTLRQLRRFVTDDCFRSLVAALVHTRFDYGTFTWVGLPFYGLRLLLSILHVAERLAFRLQRYDYVTDALAVLHRLRVPEHIVFRLAVTTYRVLHGAAPSYPDVLQRTADLRSRRRLPAILPGHYTSAFIFHTFPWILFVLSQLANVK